MAGRPLRLDAELIVDEYGTTRPLREAIAELVDDLRPLAHRLGCADELDGRADDPRGRRELRAPARGRGDNGGDLRAVVDSLLAEMQAGHPLPRKEVRGLDDATTRPAPSSPRTRTSSSRSGAICTRIPSSAAGAAHHRRRRRPR